MRIMFLGDSHGDTLFMRKAIDLAHGAEADAIMVLGDFGFWTHVPSGVKFLNKVDKFAKQKNILVTFVDGNHECHTRLNEIHIDKDGWRRVTPNIWHAPRGFIWQWEGVSFLAMGGAHSIDGPKGAWEQVRGPLDKSRFLDGYGRVFYDDDGSEKVLPVGYDLGGWWPEETIKQDEVELAIQNIVQHGDIDIMLCHDAPTITSLNVEGYPAGDANRALLQQVYEVAKPKWLFHGHYHRFNSFTDYNMDSVHICLAHNAAARNQLQYCWLDVENGEYEVIIPKMKK